MSVGINCFCTCYIDDVPESQHFRYLIGSGIGGENLDERSRSVADDGDEKCKSDAQDRFDAVRGKADVKWQTDELMALLRGRGRSELVEVLDDDVV